MATKKKKSLLRAKKKKIRRPQKSRRRSRVVCQMLAQASSLKNHPRLKTTQRVISSQENAKFMARSWYTSARTQSHLSATIARWWGHTTPSCTGSAKVTKLLPSVFRRSTRWSMTALCPNAPSSSVKSLDSTRGSTTLKPSQKSLRGTSGPSTLALLSVWSRLRASK